MSGKLQDTSDNFIRYDRHKFMLLVSLYTYEDKQYKQDLTLKNDCIISLQYVNEINKLYLEGELIYRDQFAAIDKFLEKPLTWCNVELIEVEQKFDKDIVIEKLSETERFNHVFFVNSIKIMKRENTVITYKLSLVSGNWMKCIKNISFSNYNKQPECIFDIIKSMLSMNELKTDKDTFDNSQCPVKINYITNGNDNTLTTVKYLLSKLYYYETKDEGLKCIVYDEQKDNYKLFNIQSSMTKENVSTIMLSLFKSQAENIITEEPNELNAVSKCPKINTYESELNLNFFDFNYNENKFLDKSIESKSIINFKNKFFESDKYRPKYEFFKEKDFSRNASYWNNDFDAYHAAVKTLTEDNAIVINTSGEITRKPGNFICVAVDRTANNITNDSPEDLKDLKERYKSLEGVYIIAKVRHIITPGQVQGDKQRYRQNLVVMRNFVNK